MNIAHSHLQSTGSFIKWSTDCANRLSLLHVILSFWAHSSIAVIQAFTESTHIHSNSSALFFVSQYHHWVLHQSIHIASNQNLGRLHTDLIVHHAMSQATFRAQSTNHKNQFESAVSSDIIFLYQLLTSSHSSVANLAA